MTYSNKVNKKQQDYPCFSKIDGRHPFKNAVPNGFVDYSVTTRRGGEVFYFNFDLAKEIGLVPKNHQHSLNKNLCKAILDTFSLKIINEYDIIHKTPIPKKEIRPYKYMATRYLQSQHPGRTGLTSGDGRGIWNGFYKGKNAIWDISSCGTGATKLSPATAIENKFFKTGDDNVPYGCGRADLLDGVSAAIMSEIFHHNKILTERTLAIIAFNKGTSINVRAYKNLLRPAHFFHHIKQGNYEELKGAIDYYINRQVESGDWPAIKDPIKKYQDMLERVNINFARVAAQFESKYIFCWLDWDGDNILADGGIIDYGSLRQFGLYHREYRYDDVNRMSTTIAEQKHKAKYIVQTFAQIVDFLITKKKKNIKAFSNHRIMKEFNKVFERTKDASVLYKMGFDETLQQKLLNKKSVLKDIRVFRRLFAYFEKAKSKKGLYEVEDGITWDAIFCMRDIMRELPKFYLGNNRMMEPEDFIEILRSNYATKADMALSRNRKSKIIQFQKLYWKLVKKAAILSGKSPKKVLTYMAGRSALINRYERVTGDSIIGVSEKMVRSRKSVNSKGLHDMFVEFVEEQILCPEYFERSGGSHKRLRNKKTKKILNTMLRIVKDYREGI
ncbi:MAG: protein adenylyltransferase SelO family protein [Candidatus Scalinduaceae bacterium]